MIDERPIVSVVIPCFNDEDYIQETIQSVLCQTFQNFEIVIVDDGSNESTKQLLSTLINDRIKVITQNNKGPSSARNAGFAAAKGNYVLMIDADDTFEISFLQKAVKILNENSVIGAVSSYCNMFIENHEVIYHHYPKGGNLKDFLFDNNSVSFALIRKEAWQDIDGYDEEMTNGFEDWEFWIRMTKKQWDIYVIPELLFNYRKKTRNSVDLKSKLYYRESNLSYIYKKHQDLYRSHFSEVIDFWTDLAQRHKRNEIKYKKSLEYKIGMVILFPVRMIKRIFKIK
ncbi:glycosyltransferase family 2 protein [Flavobacterium ustbae]|uniref:glycosyltransferase family 2 protein n=1 Tax=Flavobacterium ustbae TaxID=2488790 RepID=UPI000F76CA35|nr:glycosyltransferase family A protein [Flavobacterium ustbae]